MSTSALALVPPRPATATSNTWAVWESMQQTDAAERTRDIRRAPQAVGTRNITPNRIPVIIVNFSDYQMVSSKATIDSMFNAYHWATDGATGSIRQYFRDQSSGAYDPQFEVFGPVTLSKGYAYYGENGNGSSSMRAGEMVLEACALADSQIDFSQYDQNNDGNVDLVFVLFAGFGENDPPEQSLISNSKNLVWPHYWTIDNAGTGGKNRVFDGKNINEYECANELDGWYSTTSLKVVSGIGVFVHEFCHGLGLPDMYTTNGAKHKTLGMWSVMDYGPYNNDMHTPPSLNAYERWFLGWMQPTLLNSASSKTLYPLSEVNEAYYITLTGAPISDIMAPPSVFYIIENRQLTGWDIGLPGHGLLLYKVQYNSSNWRNRQVNNTASSMGVDILEADGSTPQVTTHPCLADGKQGDCYPYGMKDSITIVTAYPITHISESGDIITFDVCGGNQTATSQEDVHEEPARELFFINGHLYIRKDSRLYSPQGQCLNNSISQ